MTTPPERTDGADLTDLMDGLDDPALARVAGQLDRGLGPRPAPPEVRAALERALHERIGETRTLPSSAIHAGPALTRREALKAAAASMAFLLTLGRGGPDAAAELARLAQEQAGQGPMTAARLAGILKAERARWNALLAQVGADRMEEPGVEGAWSVKALVAHLTWYERGVVEGARMVASTGSFERERLRSSRGGFAELPLDERNAAIAEQSRARPLGDVLAEAETVFAQLLAVVAACPEDVLNDPGRIGLPEDVVPWTLVANTTYGHYREHEPAVRTWLERRARS